VGKTLRGLVLLEHSLNSNYCHDYEGAEEEVASWPPPGDSVKGSWALLKGWNWPGK
jgi:hypothetical protein